MSDADTGIYDKFQEVMDAGIRATEKDKEFFGRALREAGALRIMATVITMGREQAAQHILGLDLSETSSLMKAARAQGQIEGQMKFVEALLDFVEETEDE